MGLLGNVNLGQNGFDLITDTATHNSDVNGTDSIWFAVKAVNSDVVLGECVTTDGDDYVGTLDKGDVIYGQFTRIRRTSGGNIVAYRTTLKP